MAIVDVFRDLKNSVISVLAKKYIDNEIKEYGRIVNLQIDSKNKNILLEVLLKGEKENINIKIESYEVVQNDGSAFIKFKKVSSSREWVDVLIQNIVIPNFAPMKLIEIDSSYAKIIDLLI